MAIRPARRFTRVEMLTMRPIPAARARATMPSSSPEKSSKSRWQWLSTNDHFGGNWPLSRVLGCMGGSVCFRGFIARRHYFNGRWARPPCPRRLVAPLQHRAAQRGSRPGPLRLQRNVPCHWHGSHGFPSHDAHNWGSSSRSCALITTLMVTMLIINSFPASRCICRGSQAGGLTGHRGYPRAFAAESMKADAPLGGGRSRGAGRPRL